MMRFVVALLILTLSACAPVAQTPEVMPPTTVAPVTEIGGVLIGETVLNGDYLLVTDLLIPTESRLVIKPGTTILVRRAEMTKIDPDFLSSMTELLVRGTIIVEGTAEAPVVIAPEKTAPPGDPAWAGLLLDNVESSSIRHAQISGAETGLLMIESDIELADCLLQKNRYGLVIQGGKPLLEKNLISNGDGGLFVWNGATPTLNKNVIIQNEEEGVYIDRSSLPKFAGNRSEQNAIGLVSKVRPDRNGLQLVNNDESWRPLQMRPEAK